MIHLQVKMTNPRVRVQVLTVSKIFQSKVLENHTKLLENHRKLETSSTYSKLKNVVQNWKSHSKRYKYLKRAIVTSVQVLTALINFDHFQILIQSNINQYRIFIITTNLIKIYYITIWELFNFYFKTLYKFVYMF